MRAKGKAKGKARAQPAGAGAAGGAAAGAAAGSASSVSPPYVPSFGGGSAEAAGAAVVGDKMSAMRALLDGLSFEDGCGVLGVVPHDSGLCVATAAGPGGAIIFVRVGC